MPALPAASSPASSPPQATYRFDLACAAYARRLDALAQRHPAGRGAPFTLLLTHWKQTAVPFFCLELGLRMRALGRDVRVVWDLTDLEINHTDHTEAETGILESVLLPAVQRHFPTACIRDEPEAAGQGDAKKWREFVTEGAVRLTRSEELGRAWLAQRPALSQRVADHAGRAGRLLRRRPPGELLIPGGIYGLSGVYVAVARELGISFSTFDAGRGEFLLCHGGVGGWMEGIPSDLQELEREFAGANRNALDCVLAAARAELDQRQRGSDRYLRQNVPADQACAVPCNILMPLNLRDDAAALQRQLVFSSVDQWAQAVMDWCLRDPGRHLAIRQHTSERKPGMRTNEDLGALARAHDPEGRQLRFISAHDEVNTYALIAKAGLVLPYNSTVGVEAAILGKPVVMGAKSYYRDLGFCWPAATEAEYFSLAEQALAGRLAVTPAMVQRALLSYYLTQLCVYVFTSFTPDPEDFMGWVDTDPDLLWRQPELVDIEEALYFRRSLALLRHRRRGRA